MKKMAFLMVVVMIFSISCAKKAKVKPEVATLESETITPESSPVTLEPQPQGTAMVTKEGAPVEVGKDALSSQVPAEPAVVSAQDKPTAENIQTALKNAGLYSGNVDGKIGPKTKKAIEAFQAKNGLAADGKVGQKTWEKLKAYLNKTAEPATAIKN